MSGRCSPKGMTDTQKTSAYPALVSTTNTRMIYPPITRMKADVKVLSRKVVKDSIRGISESQLGPSEMPIADVSYCHSEGGYPVRMTFSVVLQARADSLSQSPGTERRYQADFGDYL